MPTEVISLVIAFAGACIAFAGMLGNARKESDAAAGRMSEVIAKLNFIGDDIKEMKADYRNVAIELKEVRDIAIMAKASAESAHKRLDSAGIDQNGARV